MVADVVIWQIDKWDCLFLFPPILIFILLMDQYNTNNKKTVY